MNTNNTTSGDAAPQSTTLEAAQRMVVAYECEDTVLRFLAHFDAGRFEQMKSLFDVTGQWRRPTVTIIGHKGIDDHLTSRAPSRVLRHMVTNLRTTVLSPTHARVDSYFVLYTSEFGVAEQQPIAPTAIGRYEDSLHNDGKSWRIHERDVHFDIR